MADDVPVYGGLVSKIPDFDLVAGEAGASYLGDELVN